MWGICAREAFALLCFILQPVAAWPIPPTSKAAQNLGVLSHIAKREKARGNVKVVLKSGVSGKNRSRDVYI